MALPNLPDGYAWTEVETHKAVFRHLASGKSYGVRSFSPEGLAGYEGIKSEIAYGVAKIERELGRDLELNQE